MNQEDETGQSLVVLFWRCPQPATLVLINLDLCWLWTLNFPFSTKSPKVRMCDGKKWEPPLRPRTSEQCLAGGGAWVLDLRIKSIFDRSPHEDDPKWLACLRFPNAAVASPIKLSNEPCQAFCSCAGVNTNSKVLTKPKI